MKKVFLLCGLTIAEVCVAAYNPFADGALAEVEVIVRNEDGSPVTNANVSIAFLVAPTKEDVQKGVTDARGAFRASCPTCIGRSVVEVSKDGYYDSFSRRSVRVLSEAAVCKTRKWSEGAKREEVFLRRVRNPVAMTYHGDVGLCYPATNEVLKFDLERLDWCPPFGAGKRDDVHLLFEASRDPNDWLSFANNLHLRFPHCADGFYRAKVGHADSVFKYAYQADVQAKYERALDLFFGRTAQAVTNDVRLARDECLIYRVRTQTNEWGRVTSANYGMISEGLGHLLRLKMSALFNPRANDPNLEDERYFLKQQRQKDRVLRTTRQKSL